MSEQSSTFDVSTMGTTVAELVGDGKKFKSVEDLARGKLESDGFIEKLKNENKALREALDSDQNPDEILARINSLLQSKGGSENAAAPKSNQPQTEPLSEEKVLELLSKREREKQVENNVKSFNNTINKAFGDKAGEVIASRLDEMGMEEEVFKDLAARNPNAALRILGIKESGAAGSGLAPSVNTEAFFGEAGKGNGERKNFAYFQKLRRELGTAYYEPDIQREVFAERKKQGDAFWK